MIKKQSFLFLLLLIIILSQAGICAESPNLPSDGNSKASEAERQLKINRDAFLEGSVDAAVVMIFSKDPFTRNALLEIVKNPANAKAQKAFCKALVQSAGTKENIEDRNYFISVLVEMLINSDSNSIGYVSDAVLIFNYQDISKEFQDILDDNTMPFKAKLNVLYALSQQPDPRAVVQLLNLIDGSDKELAAAAEKILKSSGVPIGRNQKERKQIIRTVEMQSREIFVQFWELRTETESQITELQSDVDWWKSRYLNTLDEIYSLKSKEAQDSNFLALQLAKEQKTEVKLWALQKIDEKLKGTNPHLPAELGPMLIDLISDPQKAIRLKTAEVLIMMRDLDSAKQLLEQFQVEKDEEVKIKLFVALGGACHYALLPDSTFKINPQIRKTTMEIAIKYLMSEDTKKSQKGADVIRKLLEVDGLDPIEVDGYLNNLAQRYKRQGEIDGQLRESLLEAMTGLCTQSVYRERAITIFGSLFEEAINDRENNVREAAVEGLISVDKAKALSILRTMNIDGSETINNRITELKSEVGGEEDLEWLASRIGNPTETDLAFKAMLAIFDRSKAGTVKKWVDILGSQDGKLSDTQKKYFLVMAEQKAITEKDNAMLKNVRKNLVDICIQGKQYEEAAKYLGLLVKSAKETNNIDEEQAFLDTMLSVYLEWPKTELSISLLANRLSEYDLGPESNSVKLVEGYLLKLANKRQIQGMLESLIAIEVKAERPGWAKQCKVWADRLKAMKDAAKPPVTSKPNEPAKT